MAIIKTIGNTKVCICDTPFELEDLYKQCGGEIVAVTTNYTTGVTDFHRDNYTLLNYGYVMDNGFGYERAFRVANAYTDDSWGIVDFNDNLYHLI